MELLVTIAMLIVANAQYLVGFILPPLVEYLNKDIPNDNVRFLVSCALCVVAAVAIDWNQISSGVIDQAHLSFLALLLFGESQTIFKLYFQSSWIRGKIQQSIGAVNAPNELG
ncbi:MAG: hypothetical protein KGJ07_01550 [Patescibacteria group bacterium]|nr:hypothetical protein [Patescibacteria group bacterium]